MDVHVVGLVINPSCPDLGCSSDRIVCDGGEEQKWGLLKFKWPVKDSVTECEKLKCSGNTYKFAG